ncbi:MAG: hypothetical protein MJA84_16600 [Firmicutes bacterium]|nr:hypothetical protein [Bacillota bacterium]
MHYRPFTLEANMCAADALQEMLLKTDQGVIKVFPAIPEEWKKGDVSFNNFRGWNGIKVSAKMKSGKLISISLETSKSAEYIIENCFDKRVLTIGKSGQKTIIDCEIGENLKIGINRDEKCIIYEA